MKFIYGVIFLTILLTGCSRYICWVEDVFNTGERTADYKNITLCYVRSMRVYDQYTTIGLFDILWLSDEVRTVYANVYACKRGLNKETYHAFLQEKLHENDQYISFYILGAIPGFEGRGGPVLGTTNAVWSPVLVIDDKQYTAQEIKRAELTPEYMRFFGKTFSFFKTAYEVIFNAQDADGQPLIKPGVTDKIKIILRRIGHQECVVWHLDKKGRSRYYPFKHTDNLFYDLSYLV